jgi:hypothetical protein
VPRRRIVNARNVVEPFVNEFVDDVREIVFAVDNRPRGGMRQWPPARWPLFSAMRRRALRRRLDEVPPRWRSAAGVGFPRGAAPGEGPALAVLGAGAQPVKPPWDAGALLKISLSKPVPIFGRMA